MAKNYLFDGHKLIYHIDRVNTFLKKGDCPPLYMEISVIGNCNHRCIFCAYDYIGYPARRLEAQRTLRFIDEIADFGVKSVLYAGEGEPLLHPDIVKFIRRSKIKGIDAGIYTNGQLLKEETAREILPLLTFIRFSFNGGTKDNYARIHNVRPEVFDRVIANIRGAVAIKNKKRLNTDIGLQYVLLPENIDYLVGAVKRLKEIGIDYFVIKPFVHQSPHQLYKMKRGFGFDAIEAALDKAERLSSKDFKVIARRDSFKGYGERRYHHCNGTSFVSVVNSAGEVAACLPYWDDKRFVFGNIYKKTFGDIWHGARRKRIKQNLEKRFEAKRCPPNCRPHAINEFLWEIKNPSVRHLNFV